MAVLYGAPGRIRTSDPQIRSLVLTPTSPATYVQPGIDCLGQPHYIATISIIFYKMPVSLPQGERDRRKHALRSSVVSVAEPVTPAPPGRRAAVEHNLEKSEPIFRTDYAPKFSLRTASPRKPACKKS